MKTSMAIALLLALPSATLLGCVWVFCFLSEIDPMFDYADQVPDFGPLMSATIGTAKMASFLGMPICLIWGGMRLHDYFEGSND